MNLPLYGPRSFPESPEESFDNDFGLGGPGEGVEADDMTDGADASQITITHGPSFLPLMSLADYRTIACVQAGAAHGRRVVLWSDDEARQANPWAAVNHCLLIEVIDLRDLVTLGSVADQLRALLGSARSRGMRDPRRALQ